MSRFAFFVFFLFVSCRSSKTASESSTGLDASQATTQTAPETKSEVKPQALKPRYNPYTETGLACASDADCGFGGYCYTGNENPPDSGPEGGPIMYCVPQLEEGGPCTTDNQCLSHVCCNDARLNPVCLGPGCF